MDCRVKPGNDTEIFRYFFTPPDANFILQNNSDYT